jgi:hypothetical protein
VSPDAQVRLYNLALARVKSSRFQPSGDVWKRMTPLKITKDWLCMLGVLSLIFPVGNILSGRKSDVAKAIAEICVWRW